MPKEKTLAVAASRSATGLRVQNEAASKAGGREASRQRPGRHSSYPAEDVEAFDSNVPLGRPGQPEAIAPSFIFLASDDSSYMTGQVLHPNGGTVVNG
jgi:NAD(P)-dependent dehydrogenase (short-subunit alcohol dehydrogenase family)